jgi:23S rRNA pseudouridine1911/1915/1917 synthase
VKHVVVAPDARGARIDQHLASVLPELTRSRIKALIEEGRVTLAGKPVHAALRLRGGESLEIEIPAAQPAQLTAQDLPLKVVFQDKDLLVLDKAAGMVVHPGAGNHDGTLVNALLFHVSDLSGIGGELRPGIVHRLDKDTSGLLVVAKNDQTLTALQAAFKAREVEKTYLALVHGAPPPQGTIRTLYGRHPRHRQRFSGKVKTGKEAVTHFRTVEQFARAALVEINLETGRTHQIRAHLAEAGYPLLGDGLYGGVKKTGPQVISRQALHAWKLKFSHPRTKKALSFQAAPPADFAQAQAELAKDSQQEPHRQPRGAGLRRS